MIKDCSAGADCRMFAECHCCSLLCSGDGRAGYYDKGRVGLACYSVSRCRPLCLHILGTLGELGDAVMSLSAQFTMLAADHMQTCTLLLGLASQSSDITPLPIALASPFLPASSSSWPHLRFLCPSPIVTALQMKHTHDHDAAMQ